MTAPNTIRLQELPEAGRRIVLALIAAQKAADMEKTGAAIVTPAPVTPMEGTANARRSTS